MKILSPAQIYEADQATIKNLPISSTDLMEKAASKCYEWIIDQFPGLSEPVHVCCGMGNNGGDGLAIARLLIKKGFKVHTYLICSSERRSEDFKVNLMRLTEMKADIREVRNKEDFPLIAKEDLVIDAIFGIGLKRTPRGFTKEFIQHINTSCATVISIDIPSGLFAASKVQDKEAVVKSSYVLSFQVPKLAFMLPDHESYIKSWEILDIELDAGYLEKVESVYHFVDHKLINAFLKKRERFSHKGTFGHSLLIGGSFGKVGAMILASKAALKAGSGLVSAYIPKCGYTAMQACNPEIMVEVDDEKYLQFFNVKTKPNAIGIGPGLGRHSKTKKGFVEFIIDCKVPLVIDADGLNIISEYEDLLNIIPKDAILTPHPKEFQRLAGSWANDYEKLSKQIELSNKLQCVLVLKGAYTSIAYKGKLYFNSSGNPGLATAGSGDVLTGIITGLLAQGYPSIEAALLGVYIHGRSADVAVASTESMESFTAMDCMTYLGQVFKEFDSTKTATDPVSVSKT